MSATELLCMCDSLSIDRRRSYTIDWEGREELRQYYQHFCDKFDALRYMGENGSEDTQWCLLHFFCKCITSPMHRAMGVHIASRFETMGMNKDDLHSLLLSDCSRASQRMCSQSSRAVTKALGSLSGSPDERVHEPWKTVSPFLQRKKEDAFVYSLGSIRLFVCDLNVERNFYGNLVYFGLPQDIALFCSLLHF